MMRPLLVEVFPEAEKLDEESEPTGPRSFAPPIPEVGELCCSRGVAQTAHVFL